MDELDIIVLCVENEWRKKGREPGTKFKTLANQCRQDSIEQTISTFKKQLEKCARTPQIAQELTTLIDRIRESQQDYIAAKDLAYKGNIRINWEQQQRYIQMAFGRQPKEGEIYLLVEQAGKVAQVIGYGLTHYKEGKPNPHVFTFRNQPGLVKQILPTITTVDGLRMFTERAYQWEGQLGIDQGEKYLFQYVTTIYVKVKDKIQEIKISAT